MPDPTTRATAARRLREASLIWGGITAGVIEGSVLGWWALLLCVGVGLVLAWEVIDAR